MRSSLLLGVAVLALLLLAGPYYTGSRVADWHAQWSKQEAPRALPGLPAGWLVKASSLGRGYFSSDLQLQLQPPERLCPQQPCPVITTTSRIHHGPLALGAAPARAALLPSQAVAVTLLDIAPLLIRQQPNPPLPPVKLVTRISPFGQLSTNFSLPASSHVLQNGSQLEYGSVTGQLHAPALDAVGDFSLQIPKATLTSLQGAVLQITAASTGQSQGPRYLQAERIELVRGGQPPVVFSGLNISLDAQPVPDAPSGAHLQNSQLELQLQSLVQGERGVGPLDFKLKTERLAMSSLLDLTARLRAIYGHEMPPGLKNMALQGLLTRLLPQLTATDPRLAIESLSLGMGDEQLQAGLDLRFANGGSPSADVKTFLKTLDFSAHAEVPAKVVQAVAVWRGMQAQLTPAEQLQTWLDKGWLVNNGSRYRASLRLADARLTVNGNESQAWMDWMAAQSAQQAELLPAKPAAGE